MKLKQNHSFSFGFCVFGLLSPLLTGCLGSVSDQSFGFSHISFTRPVLLFPQESTYYSQGIIEIRGTCFPLAEVYLLERSSQGDILLDSVLCEDQTFQFTQTKSVDGFYNLVLYQQDSVRVPKRVSAETKILWIRDTQTPDTPSITSPTTDPVYSTAPISLQGSCLDLHTVRLTGDQLESTACQNATFSFSLVEPSLGLYEYFVSQEGPSGVTSLKTSQTWLYDPDVTQTVALFHWDYPEFLRDSGILNTYVDNTLTQNNTICRGASPCVGSQKFDQCREFVRSNSSQMSVPANFLHTLVQSRMTVELFAKLTGTPANGERYVLAKIGDPGDLSWELGISRVNGAFQRIYFEGSLDGSSVTRIESSGLSIGTSDFRHIAVTWETGSVALYYEGSRVGTGSIGVGAPLYGSSAPLRIGFDGQGQHINALLDEFRLSKIIRYSGATYTVPTATFTAD